MTWFGASHFLLSFRILIPENKLFQVYFCILSLDHTFLSPRCFLKIRLSSYMKCPVKVPVFTASIEILELNSKRSLKSCVHEQWEAVGNASLIQELLALPLVPELVIKLYETRSCRCGSGVAAGGGFGRSSCSPWAGGYSWLWAQLSHLTMPSALQGCLRCVIYPLSEYPWVIQAPRGWNLSVLGVVFERNKVN